MKTYLIILLLISPLFSFGQSVTEDIALTVAKNFYAERQQHFLKKTSSEINFVKKLKNQHPISENFYIFNTDNNNGFVIVSANKKSYPVLAYSFINSFNEEDIPPEVLEWLNGYDQQIKKLKSLKSTVALKTLLAWDKYLDKNFEIENTKLKEGPLLDVSPLLSTTWNQGSYYNALCPECSSGGSGGHVWAGCVATAMAQLMKYWNYPTSGLGEHSYTHSVYGEQFADFQNTVYNWANMANSLSSHNNDVATLLYHCGVSVNMNYSPSGSGAYSSSARNSMINYFKYSSNTLLTSKYSYSEENWKKLLRAEIDAGRPMYYAGYGSGGHAFNCDGYQGTDYFHFNWGWGGSYNGYFYVDDLTPGGSNFTNSQSAFVGLLPNTMEPAFDSISAINLSCSTPYTGSTTDGENNANLYTGISWHETGKEKIHKITTTNSGRITAKITGLADNNLDVFILKYANRLTNLSSGDSIAILDDAEAGTYYIVVDGRYASEGSYTLEVICPDNKADLIVENAKVDPQYVQSEQNFQVNFMIKNIGNDDAGANVLKFYVSDDQSFSGDDVFITSVNINLVAAKEDTVITQLLTLPADLTSGTKYIVFHVDANDEVNETDDDMNFTSAYFMVPDEGILDCSSAINLADNELYTGNTLLYGDSIIDNYSCFWGLTNKEIIHSFTTEYSGLVNMELSESLDGTTFVLLLSSCNENTCINTFGIWSPDDTTLTQSFHVTGGITYYLVIDGNTDMGNSEGAYSIRLKFPDECPNPVITAGSSVNKCDGDHGAYLYTDWGYPNYKWLKDGVEIPNAINSGFTANETGLYSVKVSENGCMNESEGVQVTFSPKPSSAEISALSDTTFCEGGNVILQLSTGDGYSYQWTNNNNNIAGASSLDYEAGISGTYRAEVTSQSCTIKSNPIEVTVLHSAKGNGDILNLNKDSLISWWPFDNWGIDESGNNNYAGIFNARQTKDRDDKLSAFSFDGQDDYIYTSKIFEHPDTFTISLWFKTTKSGKLIGFDEQRFTETSVNYDRHLYLDNSGRIHFGVEPGTKHTISSTASYNDDSWHMVSASLSLSGMKLYVDTELIAQNSGIVSGGVYAGYWKMAQGNLAGWENDPGKEYFEGKLDDILIYNRELSIDEIEILYSNQVLKIYAENEVICSSSGITAIIIDNSEPNIQYQLKNADDHSLIDLPVQGNAGAISLATGNLTETTNFKIFASNLKTSCSKDLDTIITVFVNTSVSPSVNIYSNKPENEICAGDSITFGSTVQFGGSLPVYQWQINGINTGIDTTIFSSNSLSDNDIIKLFVTSSIICADPKTAISEEIIVKINDLPDNTLIINGSTDICEGDSTIISANANADYEWYLIGQGRLDTTHFITIFNSGEYFLRLENEFGCINYSDTIEFSFFPTPFVNIGNDTSIFTNESVIIGPDDSFESYLWNTGSEEQNITVDGNIGIGEHEYWLKINDEHCSNNDTIVITITQTTGIEDMLTSSEIKIFPNPARKYIEIKFTNHFSEDLTIEMRNSLGELVWSKKYLTHFSFFHDKIKLDNYPAGLYFLNFITDISNISKKVIIE